MTLLSSEKVGSVLLQGLDTVVVEVNSAKAVFGRKAASRAGVTTRCRAGLGLFVTPNPPRSLRINEEVMVVVCGYR
jgi:hypothetical protein